MNKMLKNYYAKLRNKQKTCLNLLSDLQKQKKKKRTASQSALNNLTKTSEKSAKPKPRHKSIKSIVIIKSMPKTSHQPKYSEVPRVALNKSKLKKKPKKLKHQSILEPSAPLSDSYDSFLNDFQCPSELRNSLKRLVILEKNELKRKFNRSKGSSGNSIFYNSYHNSKSLNS